jgi:hypothetical protein
LIVLTGVSILCLAIIFGVLGATGVFKKESSQAEVNANAVRTATASAHELRCSFPIRQLKSCRFLLRGEPSRILRHPALQSVRQTLPQALPLTLTQWDPP